MADIVVPGWAAWIAPAARAVTRLARRAHETPCAVVRGCAPVHPAAGAGGAEAGVAALVCGLVACLEIVPRRGGSSEPPAAQQQRRQQTCNGGGTSCHAYRRDPAAGGDGCGLMSAVYLGQGRAGVAIASCE